MGVGLGIRRVKAAGNRLGVSNVPSPSRWAILGIACAVALGAAVYVWNGRERPPPAPVQGGVRSQMATSVGAPPTSLSNSRANDIPTTDADLESVITSTLGLSSWPAFAYPDNVLRRLVATVDALPRAQLPGKIRVIRPIPGTFLTAGPGDSPRLASPNSARYDTIVTMFEQISPSAIGELYARLYPRLQQSYEDLGYPGRSFHTRLLEAIDDLLASPEVPENAALSRPNVLYLYADPALERCTLVDPT